MRRIFSHGMLMFDSDLRDLSRTLDVTPDKIKPKAQKSVQMRVANIAAGGGCVYDVPTFKKSLIEGIFRGENGRRYRLGREEWNDVRTLVERRYE